MIGLRDIVLLCNIQIPQKAQSSMQSMKCDDSFVQELLLESIYSFFAD